MSDPHQILLHKRSSQHLSGDTNQFNPPSKPKPGTKRLFSNLDSIVHLEKHRDENLETENDLLSLPNTDGKALPQVPPRGHVSRSAEEENDLESPVEKRNRTSDWPLRTTSKSHDAPPRPTLCNQHSRPSSPRSHKRTPSQPRSSKFIEGSMNDRASQKPHPSYVGDSEETWDPFENGQKKNGKDRKKARLHNLEHHANHSMALSSVGDKSETSRSSVIFRFGKSLAAAFNPSSWRIWPKPQEGDQDPQEKNLRERGEKAEKIYKELRRTRQLRSSTHVPMVGIQINHGPYGKHDSGVAFNLRSSTDAMASADVLKSEESSKEAKRYGRIFLDLPNIASLKRSESPASEAPSSPRKSSFHFREPSLPNIHMAQSNTKPSFLADDLSKGHHGLRRLPSRRDLQKQQKLVKRVSDLEGKLEAARRQLSEALGEPFSVQSSLTGRPLFRPGALASLPSEHLLSVHAAPEPEYGSPVTFGNIGKAISTDDRTGRHASRGSIDDMDPQNSISNLFKSCGTLSYEKSLPEPRLSVEIGDTQDVVLQASGDTHLSQAVTDAGQGTSETRKPMKQPSKKRKSIGLGATDDGGRYKPSPDSSNDDTSEGAGLSISKRKPGRPRKIQKIDPKPKPPRAKGRDTAAKSDAAGAVAEFSEADFLLSHNIQQPKNRRVVLSKKAPSSVNSSRIPRKGRHPTSPPPSQFTAITNIAGELNPAKQALREDDSLITVSTIPSADVPPVPELPTAMGSASSDLVSVPITGISSEIHTEIDTSDGKTFRDRKKVGGLTKDGDKEEMKRKQSFEWPADVF